MIERSLGSSTRILDPVTCKGDPTESPPSGDDMLTDHQRSNRFDVADILLVSVWSLIDPRAKIDAVKL
ncbi:hypothetical protein RchiOBHm_Chr2g0154111 [Rosa chinensis]|uniref:Uncharacterized protein n=1 Tax=Rosa chinensis TaxID=74649 RepID=A0A2P6S0Y4_ROSCH|nr:hypothetical protein RchiOBHm_Chr2g0154111 [Rosa chinensis]